MLRPLVSFKILKGLRPLRQGSGERRLLDRQRRAVRLPSCELEPDILVLNEARLAAHTPARRSTMAVSSPSATRRRPFTMGRGAM
jgi:hypothetical protein